MVGEILKYSSDHLWVKKEDHFVRVGITEQLQSELDDIVFVELPEIGERVEKNEPFVNIESVKTVSEIYSPVSGKIVEINESVENDPKIMNSSPYDKGWLIVIELTNEKELDTLLTKEEYENKINK